MDSDWSNHCRWLVAISSPRMLPERLFTIRTFCKRWDPSFEPVFPTDFLIADQRDTRSVIDGSDIPYATTKGRIFGLRKLLCLGGLKNDISYSHFKRGRFMRALNRSEQDLLRSDANEVLLHFRPHRHQNLHRHHPDPGRL